MKRKLLKTTMLATTFVLLTASSLADARCDLDYCRAQLFKCARTVTPYFKCEVAYATCLTNHGCVVP
jgi:hypothetical protein